MATMNEKLTKVTTTAASKTNELSKKLKIIKVHTQAVSKLAHVPKGKKKGKKPPATKGPTPKGKKAIWIAEKVSKGWKKEMANKGWAKEQDWKHFKVRELRRKAERKAKAEKATKAEK